jgi:protease IV
MKRYIVIVIMALHSAYTYNMQYVQNFFKGHQDLIVEQPVQEIKPNVAFVFIQDQLDCNAMILQLMALAKDPNIQGVLLIIDNTGGRGRDFAIRDLLVSIKKRKPVVALIIGHAASGGYLLASAADYIIAHTLSEVGSIGVMLEMTKYKNTKLTGPIKAELDIEVLRAGKFKGLWHPNVTLSEQDKSYYAESIQAYYMAFLKLIAQERNLSVEQHEEWADGREFIAEEAVKVGLIDEVGTMFEAEQVMLRLIQERNPECVIGKEITPIMFEKKEQAA